MKWRYRSPVAVTLSFPSSHPAMIIPRTHSIVSNQAWVSLGIYQVRMVYGVLKSTRIYQNMCCSPVKLKSSSRFMRVPAAITLGRQFFTRSFRVLVTSSRVGRSSTVTPRIPQVPRPNPQALNLLKPKHP